jgi:cation:H+ antiporter
MTYLQLLAGLALLLAGGELLVRGSVAVASRLGVSPFVIGLTLVGFGTSTPELITSIDAVLANAPGLAIGNVVGSNIANILLVLGCGAVLMPIRTTPAAFFRDGSMVLGASLLLAIACWHGAITRPTGAAFLGVLLTYTLYTYLADRRANHATAALHAAQSDSVEPLPGVPGTIGGPLAAPLAAGLAGIIGILAGAHILVDAAITMARLWQISDALIGLTVVALGTSLPELATAIVAAYHGRTDVALGNILGSNVFNCIGIPGVTALVAPIAIPADIARFDIWIMLGVTLAAAIFAFTGWRISRREGAILLLAYVAYIILIASRELGGVI